MRQVFTGNFTQQEPLSEDAVQAALAVLRHGRLHRYNTIEGETAQSVLFEQEFAAYTGAKYCLAVTSGGYALTTALRACGLKKDDIVLTNAFTLAPVPGAIFGAGGVPLFVEITKELVLDLEDLKHKIITSGARFLMVSHMRGHIVDMEALMALCNAHDVIVIEDCAHTLGASWGDLGSGRWGNVGCYSTQTFKHMNSGEGGVLITDDCEIMARATMLSGSYMFYESHAAGPQSDVYKSIKFETPNCSGRMDNLRAALLRPQLENLDKQVSRWNKRYHCLEDHLKEQENIKLIPRPKKERYVGSSFQFYLPLLSARQIIEYVRRCKARGISLQWFGADIPVGFTSRYDSWRYVEAQTLPQSDAVLAILLDMRIPLTFSIDDCICIATIMKEEIEDIHQF